jgi:hypothetical protein
MVEETCSPHGSQKEEKGRGRGEVAIECSRVHSPMTYDLSLSPTT